MPRPTDSHLCHVAMYLWTICPDPGISDYVWPFFQKSIIIDVPSFIKEREDFPLRRFLDEVIVSTGREKLFVNIITRLLEDAVNVDELLAAYVNDFIGMFLAFGTHFNSFRPAFLERLRRACFSACQRQLCSGQFSATEKIHNILINAFYLQS